MMRGLYTASAGMTAQQFLVDVIANNMANVNTNGFKKARVDFQDLLYQTVRPAGTTEAQGENVPSGIQVGHGTRVADTQRIFSQGNFKLTDNPLDMVIQGDGFFRVQMPDGTFEYTRDGSFTMDENGQVVNSQGLRLDPAITIPNTAVSINVGSDGTVSALLAGQTDSTNLGQIQLVKFVNPAGLIADGSNLFRETAASGAPIQAVPGQNGLGTIANGFLENSNVSVVEEMINLVVAQRAYDMNAKIVTASDEMLATANQMRR